jgi:hypothetical protein
LPPTTINSFPVQTDEKLSRLPSGQGPLQIAPQVPERRAEHPATVQRQRRQQVEREQDEVGKAKPGHHAIEGVRQSRDCRDEDEENAQRERHEWPSDRDPELGACARKAALELRDTAEEPEVDPLDLDPVSPRLQGVTELVE